MSEKFKQDIDELIFNFFQRLFIKMEDWLKHHNIPAQIICPKESIMPNGECTPSVQEAWEILFHSISLDTPIYPKKSILYKKALENKKRAFI